MEFHTVLTVTYTTQSWTRKATYRLDLRPIKRTRRFGNIMKCRTMNTHIKGGSPDESITEHTRPIWWQSTYMHKTTAKDNNTCNRIESHCAAATKHTVEWKRIGEYWWQKNTRTNSQTYVSTDAIAHVWADTWTHPILCWLLECIITESIYIHGTKSRMNNWVLTWCYTERRMGWTAWPQVSLGLT